MTRTIRVHPRAFRRARRGHPWIFRDDMIDVGSARDGDLVQVVQGEPSRAVGFALYSAASKIALRRVSDGTTVPDPAFWDARVAQAVALRERVVTETDARRLVFGESDGLPGLVIDDYAGHLVAQCLTAAAERLLPTVVEALRARVEVISVLARNDSAVRRLENLPREVIQIAGKTPARIEVNDGTLHLSVDPWEGQKTGAFLDQRENRRRVAELGARRMLDVFCYQGAFALAAAAAGAEAIGIDSSASAVERSRENAQRNGLGAAEFVCAAAFDELRRRVKQGERFDLVVVDPPALAKRRSDVKAAHRAYREINLRAMQLLGPGGMLVSCSCSYHLSEETLISILAEAAVDARRTIVIEEKRAQSRDHPIRLGFPESHYLKCMVLRVS